MSRRKESSHEDRIGTFTGNFSTLFTKIFQDTKKEMTKKSRAADALCGTEKRQSVFVSPLDKGGTICYNNR